MNAFRPVCVVLAGLLAAVSSGRADVLYQDDFTTAAPGSNPADWRTSSSVATTHKIAADPSNPDDPVLSTPGGTARTTGSYHALPATVVADTGLRLSFDLYIGDARDANWNSRWYAGSGVTGNYAWFTPGYGFQLNKTAVRIHKTAGGGVSGNPGAATTLVTENLPADAYGALHAGWTRVEFEWFASGLLRLSLNGRRVATFVDPSPLAPTLRTLSTVSFLNNNAANGPVFTGAALHYDNLFVSAVPLQDGFDPQAVGSSPPGWFNSTSTATTHAVAADALDPANRVLSTPGGSYRTTGAYRTAAAATTITGAEDLKLSFDLYVAAAGDKSWNSRWYLGADATGNYGWFTPGYGLQLNATSVKIHKTSGGGVSGNPGAAVTVATASLAPGAYTPGGWTTVEFVWRAGGTLDVLLNGTRAVSYIDPEPPARVFRTLSTVSFLNNNAANGPVFTGGVLQYDNLAVSLLRASKPEVTSLVIAATDPAGAHAGDPAMRARAVAATDALATELGGRAARYEEITVLLECIYHWWRTASATTPQLEAWLAGARASVELHHAANAGVVDAPWTTVGCVLELLAQEVAGGPAATPPPLLPDPGALVPARFSAAPAAGVHPRILVSAADLPAVRSRLAGTACGVRVRSAISGFIATATGPGKPLCTAYDQLVAGDVNAMESVAPADAWWRGQMAFVICYEAFLALIDENTVRGERAAAALTTYAGLTAGQTLDGTDTLDEFIGFAYDFAFAYLTPVQKTAVRAVIAAATAGRSSYGMDGPASHHRSNLSSHGMKLLLMALAIEGEAGYDTTLYARSVAVMTHFLAHGIDAQGAPREDMHYLNFGLARGAPALVAMARRGDNLLTSEHYRRLQNWYVHAMEPFGQAFSQHDDTPNDGGGLLPNYALMKWVWPSDPVVNFVWKNRVRPNYSKIDYRADWLFSALFPSDWSGADPDPTAGATALGLPLSWQGEERKLFIARDRWDKDALALHFEANPSLVGPSHTHSNCGDFTLSALGRKWAIDRGFHIAEAKDHSLVLIDGQGQGFFAAPGRWVESRDDGELALAAVDARYPYAWSYEFKSRIGLGYRNTLPWEPELFMGVREYQAETAGPEYQDAPWNSPNVNYTYKIPHNPVTRAFRTAALRRGENPYVLILDDIRKDNATHTYTWQLQVADDLEIKQTQSGQVVLGGADPQDDRRLLVRMLGSQAGTWQLETFDIVRSPETGSNETFGQGRRLKFTCSAVELKLKVLLLPHRSGDALPTTTLTALSLAVVWSQRRDDYTLGVLAGGRTSLALQP